MYGGDGEGKLYFLLLKFIKRKKAYFWAKCLNSLFLSPIVVPRIYETTAMLLNMMHLSMLMWREGVGRWSKARDLNSKQFFGSNALPQGRVDVVI